MQLIRTILKNLVEDHPETISVDFGQIPISGSWEDVVWTFHYAMQPLGQGQFWPQGHNLNSFGRGPLDDAIYQIWKLWALKFSTSYFF